MPLMAVLIFCFFFLQPQVWEIKVTSISLPSTHVPLAFLGSNVHAASIDAISPNCIIGGKTCARGSGPCHTISSDSIVFTINAFLLCWFCSSSSHFSYVPMSICLLWTWNAFILGLTFNIHVIAGIFDLQSFTRCLRLTLIFVWNSALRKKFNFYFSRFFASINKIFILTGGMGTRLLFYEV